MLTNPSGRENIARLYAQRHQKPEPHPTLPYPPVQQGPAGYLQTPQYAPMQYAPPQYAQPVQHVHMHQRSAVPVRTAHSAIWWLLIGWWWAPVYWFARVMAWFIFPSPALLGPGCTAGPRTGPVHDGRPVATDPTPSGPWARTWGKTGPALEYAGSRSGRLARIADTGRGATPRSPSPSSTLLVAARALSVRPHPTGSKMGQEL